MDIWPFNMFVLRSTAERVRSECNKLARENAALGNSWRREVERTNRVTTKLLTATRERDALQAKLDRMAQPLKAANDARKAAALARAAGGTPANGY